MKWLCGVLLLVISVSARCWADTEAKPAADPAAGKLLDDARAARAVWKDFPGFTADLEVNVEGKIVKGRVTVSPKGEVKLALPESEQEPWARRTLASVVGHRLDDGGGSTACVFADDNADHPLGRLIRPTDDEFHSSYRIRDRQILVVNRAMKDGRFSITVTENVGNKEGKFLPACFVVNTWDAAGSLTGSETHRQTWTHVGAFDLPESLTVVGAKAGGQEVRSLKLTDIRLASPFSH